MTAGVGSWEYVDEYMTVPRFEILRKHWDKSPPIHVSVAAIAFGLGVLKPKSSASSSDKKPSRAELLQDLKDAGVQIPGVKLG